jgi:hypothetical protein
MQFSAIDKSSAVPFGIVRGQGRLYLATETLYIQHTSCSTAVRWPPPPLCCPAFRSLPNTQRILLTCDHFSIRLSF